MPHMASRSACNEDCSPNACLTQSSFIYIHTLIHSNKTRAAIIFALSCARIDCSLRVPRVPDGYVRPCGLSRHATGVLFGGCRPVALTLNANSTLIKP